VTDTWAVECGDAGEWLRSLPEGGADLVIGSPPYTQARSYLENGVNLGIARDAEAWTAWMVDITRAALRACRGLVAWVAEGQTDDFSWDAAPMLLAADLKRAGITLRRNCYYRRSGIPGSGGKDWFRCDAELVICCTNGGRLPWADPTACGHPPKWAPGGAMSHRLNDGKRVNAHGVRRDGIRIGGRRGRNDHEAKLEKPSHASRDVATKPHTKARRRTASGDVMEEQFYEPPVLANPGNVVTETYTAAEVDELLGLVGTTIDCKVGGGQMGEGDAFSRLNEAPFPETLAERFVLSFAPPGGLVIDPFTGSGTTGAVAVRHGRRFKGCDLRQSQVLLAKKRIACETPLGLFNAAEGTDAD
jgi:hypothetical protein